MKKLLFLLIASFAVLFSITSCSEDDDYSIKEFSTLAKYKMTRGAGESSTPILSVEDSVLFQYDIKLCRTDTAETDSTSFNAIILVMFSHNKGKPKVELKEYLAPGGRSVASVYLTKHWDSEIYELHATGKDYLNRGYHGMLSSLFSSINE